MSPIGEVSFDIFRCAEAFDHIWLSGIRYLLCGHHELYADIYCHPKPSCQRRGVHKCSGASSGNIFGMFLAETGILVIFSVLLSLLLIVNAHEIIEDLLSVRLSSLFAWETLWVPLLTIVILFLLAGGIPGRLFSRIPVTQVFRRYSDGKTGWKRSLLFIQFTGVSFVLGLLLVTLLQYNHL